MVDAITVKIEGIEELQRRLKSVGLNANRIISRAINSTASHVKALATADIMEKWNVQKKKDVQATMKIKRATTASLTASVEMTSKPLSFSKFGMERVPIKKRTKEKRVTKIVRGKKRSRMQSRSYTRYGVKVALLRGQSAEIVEKAFPGRMPSGHRGAFLRRSTRSLPIFEKKSISPTSMWLDYIDQHIAKANPYLRARVIGQLEALLAKGRT